MKQSSQSIHQPESRHGKSDPAPESTTRETRLCQATFETWEENLALDEALWVELERSAWNKDVLRVWEPSRFAVVVGRGSRVEDEVNLPACSVRAIPVLRRVTGGSAVVLGPGCLAYALAMARRDTAGSHPAGEAHRYVLSRLAEALGALVPGIRPEGTSDLVVGGKKFSGNSLRVGRRAILYHGTILYRFPLAMVQECLRVPPRQPAYRGGRSHIDFLANLPLAASAIRSAVRRAFAAEQPVEELPRALVRDLIDQRYARRDWHAGR